MGENLITPNVRNFTTVVIMVAVGFWIVSMVHKFAKSKMGAANSASA